MGSVIGVTGEPAKAPDRFCVQHAFREKVDNSPQDLEQVRELSSLTFSPRCFLDSRFRDSLRLIPIKCAAIPAHVFCLVFLWFARLMEISFAERRTEGMLSRPDNLHHLEPAATGSITQTYGDHVS